MGEVPFLAPTEELARLQNTPIAIKPPRSTSLINRVTCGDCLNILPKIPSAAVDFILTDPPYLVRYCDRAGRSVANDDQDDWLIPAVAEMYRVLKWNSFCVSFYGWSKVDRFFTAWRGAGFYPVAHLVWTKRYASRSRYVGYHHEQAYVLAKGRPAMPRSPLPDVLRWQYTENRLHPTQKPVSGLMPVVQAFTADGDIVLDPFCGSGSSLVAAYQLGRRYVGIELDPAHSAVAQRRLQETTAPRFAPRREAPTSPIRINAGNRSA